MILAVDIGNSRIKWALWQDGQMQTPAAIDYRSDNLSALLDANWQSLVPATTVMLACVAGEAVEQLVQQWLQQHWQLQARVLRSSPQFGELKHGYAQTQDHGVDRWAAMIAARALYQTPVCVLGCGTATTVDLIDASGQHLGGQIMPGSELMISAVQARAPGLALHAIPESVPAGHFATASGAALRLGVMQMAAAGLDRACDEARALLGADMKILISGGAATAIMPLMKNATILQPYLVLQGLVIAAQQDGA